MELEVNQLNKRQEKILTILDKKKNGVFIPEPDWWLD